MISMDRKKIQWLKTTTPILTALIFVLTFFILFTASQNAEQSVHNHTQTLTEIQQAINQLKQSNEADHVQTVKYINCVLVGITQASPPSSQSAILAIYQTCLTDAGIDNTNP